MNIRKITTLVALPVAAFALGAVLFSQPAPQEPGQDAMPIPVVEQTKWHKMLAKGAGAWDVQLEMQMFPGAEPQTFTGTEMNTSICNGLWMESRFTAEFMGMPFEGRSIIGFDPRKEKVQMIWVDNMNDGMSIGEGVYSKDGKTLTTMTKGFDPMSGKEKTTKMVEELLSADKRTLTFYDRDENGEWASNMKMTYTRRK